MSTPTPGARVADVHRDALAVPEHAQLLERFDALERARRERGIARAGSRRGRRRGRRGAAARRRRSASRAPATSSRGHGIGAREKYSAWPRRVEHDLDDVGVGEVGARRRSDARRCSSRSRRASLEQRGAGVDQRRVDQRLVALHVDDDRRRRRGRAPRTPRPGGRCRWRGRRASARASTPCARAGGDDRRRRRWRRRRARAARLRGALARRARPSACRRCRRAACRGRRVEASRAGIRTVNATRQSAASRRAASAPVSRPSARASPSSITGMPSRTGKARRSALQTSSWRSCCGGRSAAAAPCRAGRRAAQAGVFPCGSSMASARAGGSSASSAASNAGAGAKSSGATQTRVPTGARRVELDRVLLGHHDVARSPAGQGSAREVVVVGQRQRARRCEAVRAQHARRSAPGAPMPATATTLAAAQRVERGRASALRRATSRRARATPASARRARKPGSGVVARGGVVEHELARRAARAAAARAAARPAAAGRCRRRARRTRAPRRRARARGAAGRRR